MTGMMDLQYVQAEHSDVNVILSLSLELVKQYEDLASVDYDKISSWLRKRTEENIERYTCVLHHGQKVAFYCLLQQDGGTELDDFYVLPQFRNKGIGSEILKKCCEDAKMPMFLYVFANNIGAVSLYRRNGFSISKQVSPTRYIMTRHT